MLAVFGKCDEKKNSLLSPIIMHNTKLYLVIAIISLKLKSKVKIRHSIFKVIYPRGIFS